MGLPAINEMGFCRSGEIASITSRVVILRRSRRIRGCFWVTSGSATNWPERSKLESGLQFHAMVYSHELFSVHAGKRLAGGSRNMRLLPTMAFVRRLIAALWIAVYVWLLVRTLVLRNASPQVFSDAEYLEQILIMALSMPLCGLILLPVTRWGALSWWAYPANDVRTILAIWLCFFVIGCVQWFVLVPWIIHKGFDLYDRLVLVIHKKQRHLPSWRKQL
jgi:hypothetical protein